MSSHFMSNDGHMLAQITPEDLRQPGEVTVSIYIGSQRQELSLVEVQRLHLFLARVLTSNNRPDTGVSH